jgi:hypothetical protein
MRTDNFDDGATVRHTVIHLSDHIYFDLGECFGYQTTSAAVRIDYFAIGGMCPVISK